MSQSENVLWKCGSCNDCFCDLQIFAGHKCIENGGTVALTESCIKELEVQSYDADLTASADQVQEISALSIIESQEIAELGYPSSSFHKPTIISVKKNSEFKKHQKGKRSIVWTYFTALDDKKAMCCICQKVISYCGTPTNLVYHLSRYHPAEGDVVKSKQANNIKYQYLSNKLPKPCSSDKKAKYRGQTISILPQVAIEAVPNITAIPKKVVTDKIIEMLLVDMLPLDILEGTGFKKLIHSLDPTYKLPTKKEFFIDHIPKKYYAEYKKVQNIIKEANKVHASIELWTGYADKEFLTISAHFVTNDFHYKYYTLNTIPLDDDYTYDILTTSILTCISQWDLSLDIMCLVTDCSAIMGKIAKSTGWKHVICFAHMLNNIITEALSASLEVKKLLDKCRTIVNFLRNHDTAKQQLLENQMQNKHLKIQHAQSQVIDINAAIEEKYPLKIKKDNPNEWITTFYMLQRIATLKNLITKILNNFPSVEGFTANEWLAIDETISLLKSFEVVILELCNEPYQYASKVIPVTLGLMSLINNCNTLKLNSIEQVRKGILNSLRKRLGQVELNLTLAMATVLDPRFKNIAFQLQEAVDSVIQELKVEACSQAEHDTALLNQSNNIDNSLASSTDSLWEGFDKKATPKKAPNSAGDIISNEIKHYLDEPLLDRKKDPFLWWKKQGQAQFPILAKIAKQILCIPATSIPPERVFLKKGRTFSEKRKLIKPKYVDQFMFLNLNID